MLESGCSPASIADHHQLARRPSSASLARQHLFLHPPLGVFQAALQLRSQAESGIRVLSSGKLRIKPGAAVSRIRVSASMASGNHRGGPIGVYVEACPCWLTASGAITGR